MKPPIASERASPSLTSRLMGGMVLPMAGLAILLGVGGAWVIEESVEAVFDRNLSAAARGIAESLIVRDKTLGVVIPPAAFAMLADDSHDKVYFRIIHQGRTIAGNDDLPEIAANTTTSAGVTFGKPDYRGHRVRLIQLKRQVSGVDGVVTTEVAETMFEREQVVARMMLLLAALELVLITASAILIPVAVRWGLAPLRQLRNEMDQRRASDFTPLSIAKVPQELRDLVGAFNGLLGRLEAAVQGMRRFTADASHQMRTPLSILRTHVSVLRKAKPDSDEARSSLDDIDHATVRLQNLLVQLLALARADSAAPMNAAMEPVNLVEIARQVANEHAPMALQHKAKLAFDSTLKNLTAISHPTLLIELLSNLLDNAITYNLRGGSVRVEVMQQDGVPMIVIEDSGPGIPEADRERVFERFTRLQPDIDQDGTGLGLSIVKALSDAMNADVRLVSGRNGQGLRAEVVFPTTAF